MAKGDNGLTFQQEKFATLCGSGIPQAEAYRQAYPISRRWKPESVHSKASTAASHVMIRKRITEIQEAAAAIAGLDKAQVLSELKRLVHSDIGGITDASGRVLLPHELNAVTRASISSFKIDEFGRIEYKFWDKNSALDKAMKHLGLYEKDNEQQPAVVQQVRLIPLKRKTPPAAE